MIYEFAFQGALSEDALNGIRSVTVHADRQVVLIESKLPSQKIMDKLNALLPTRFVLVSSQSTLIGESSVCIFEHFAGMKQEYAQFENRGICRLTTSDHATAVDLSVSGLVPGAGYRLDVNEYGNIEEGCASTGGLFRHCCVFVADGEGRGVFAREIGGGGSLIGRALVISRAVQDGDEMEEVGICGVVARSAGVLQNRKTICSCSGQTVWEEREHREI